MPDELMRMEPWPDDKPKAKIDVKPFHGSMCGCHKCCRVHVYYIMLYRALPGFGELVMCLSEPLAATDRRL